MKRARADSLTGGTGDVNPQFLSGAVTTLVADTSNTIQVPLPVARAPGATGNRVQVVEILKMWIDLPRSPAIAAVGESAKDFFFSVSTAPIPGTGVGFGDWADAKVIWYVEYRMNGAFTAAGTYYTGWVDQGTHIDLTDGVGHGILVGTDNLFFTVSSNNLGSTLRASFKVLYRFKNVGLAEYIGIVQSQQ